MDEKDKEIALLKKELMALIQRCVYFTEGDVCQFCDVRCEFRTAPYKGKGQKI